MNNTIELREYISAHKYFEWLYSQKSEYGLILVLCMAFLAINQAQFKNVLTYILSQGVLLVALYLSGSYASMMAAILIFVGQFLDYLVNAKWWKKLIVLCTIPLSFFWVSKQLLIKIATNRDILTLGHRTYIWNTFTELIKQNPNGMPGIFGVENYNIPEWYYLAYTTNGHNVFLNHILRFSIPVGGIFCTLFVLITLISIKRNWRFSTLFIWIAFYIPMTIDHALTTMELTYFVLLTYILFLRNFSCNSFKEAITDTISD